METLSRRLSHSFGTWSGFKKNTLRHGKSLTNIIPAFYANSNSNGWTDKPQVSSTDDSLPRQSGSVIPSTLTDDADSGRGTISSSSRSRSLNSINSDEAPAANPAHPADCPELPTSSSPSCNEIVALTNHVREFKEALSRLRRIFHPGMDRLSSIRSLGHERLGLVLRILRGILEKYGHLQSTELLMAAGQLIQQVKGFNFEDEKSDRTEFYEAIDQVALAFSNRVSEYLMGDFDSSSSIHPAVRHKSCDNLHEPDDELAKLSANRMPDVMSPDELDECLMRLEQDQGVNVALTRAKIWAKYAKDVVTYVEKRCALELEHCRSVGKLAYTMRPLLKEESFLPFQSVYCTALDQDADNANLMQATCSLLQGHKFIEPLTARRNEHEKVRKQLKDSWQREMKKMQDSKSNLHKARTLYIQRQLDYEKAKDSVQRAECVDGLDANKVEKKRRIEEDALQKASEAETTYKACVVEANDRHHIMQKVKGEILKQVRELILQCDQTMKAATVSYFQLQHTVAAPAPVQFQTLCENSRLYEPGSQYMEFIKRLPIAADAPVIQPPPFSFEPYVPTDSRLNERRSNSGLEGSEESLVPVSTPSQSSMDQSKGGRKVFIPVSDSDSVGSGQSNKSVDTSPFGSPQILSRRLDAGNEDLEMDQEVVDPVDGLPNRGFSNAAGTHNFRKLKTPSRCRECDTYVYFQGVECPDCGLTCHKKCAETLAIQCGHKRLKPKLTTFGVDLLTHLSETQADVPHLVTRCIRAIDERGACIKGIYRVSGVKSKVEKLCQSFESGAELVDLNEFHPNVVANVLKLYLRQLPEPLLAFRLYVEFLEVAKKYPGNRKYDGDETEEIMREMEMLLRKLPRCHFQCLTAVIHHLKRVSDLSEINNMPASNLGIVFGPTLLRTNEDSASLVALMDTHYQSRIVELLITYSQKLFGPDESKVSKPEPVVPSSPECDEIEGKSIDELDEDEPWDAEMMRAVTSSPTKPEVESDRFLKAKPILPAVIDDDSISTHSFDMTDGEGELPVPPPRRHLSQTRLNRSAESDCEVESTNRSSSLPSVSDILNDRIVIHVEAEMKAPVAAPRTLAPSDFESARKDGDGREEDVPFVDDLPSDSSLLLTTTGEVAKKFRPVPLPRFGVAVKGKEVAGKRPGGLGVSEPRSPSLSPRPSPSPGSSVPSTSSSFEELDYLGDSPSSRSPTPGSDYVTTYLTNDPYKNLRVSVHPQLCMRPSTFAGSDNGSTNTVVHPRGRQRQRRPSNESDSLGDLGSRNSLLRTATRHQRCSPALSTGSTKSSSESAESSPLPEDVESRLSPMNHRRLAAVKGMTSLQRANTTDSKDPNGQRPRFV